MASAERGETGYNTWAHAPLYVARPLIFFRCT
jgi:hypothetical protein